MEKQPDASALEPYADDLYQAVTRAIPRWITTQVSEIASLSIDETSQEFQSALADVAKQTHQVSRLYASQTSTIQSTSEGI